MSTDTKVRRSKIIGIGKCRWRIPEINIHLLPVKAQAFFYSAGVRSITPYVSLHLKKAGLSTADITIISSFQPFVGSLGPVIVGFCTDKIGRYKPVTAFVLCLTAAIFSSILLVPPYGRVTKSLGANITCYADQNLIFVDKCGRSDSCEYSLTVSLQECRRNNLSAFGECAVATSCTYLNQSHARITADLSNKAVLKCIYQIKEVYRGEDNDTLVSSKLCSHRCHVVTPHYTCERVVGQWEYTFWSLLVIRLLAQFFMASSVNVMDTTMVGALKNHGGEYGKHRMLVFLANVAFPSLSGALMDLLGSGTGKSARWPAYFLMDICFSVVVLLLLPMTIHQEKMRGSTVKNLKQLTTDRRCVVIFIQALFFGLAPGVLNVFLPIFLLSLNSPMYIIGMKYTASSISSIIVLFFSDWVVNRAGHINILCVGFLISAVRFLCYSMIQEPWWAILIEAMKSFSQHLCWVALVKWADMFSPEGLLSTTLGTIRASAYGVGRTIGIVIGGSLMVQLGDRKTFQVMAVIHVALSLVWLFLHHCLLKRLIFKDKSGTLDIQDAAKSKLTSTTVNGKLLAIQEPTTDKSQSELLSKEKRLLD